MTAQIIPFAPRARRIRAARNRQTDNQPAWVAKSIEMFEGLLRTEFQRRQCGEPGNDEHVAYCRKVLAELRSGRIEQIEGEERREWMAAEVQRLLRVIDRSERSIAKTERHLQRGTYLRGPRRGTPYDDVDRQRWETRESRSRRTHAKLLAELAELRDEEGR